MRGAGIIVLLAAVAAHAAQAQGHGGGTGEFQRDASGAAIPDTQADDATAWLFRPYNQLYNAYNSVKQRIAADYNLTISLQTSYFLQSAVPDGGRPVSLFVYSPWLTWTPLSDPAWGTGQVTIAYWQNQYWSGTTTAAQQLRIGTVTSPNDWLLNGYAWSQVTYTHTLPGALNWLSVTAGQYAIGGFDGNLYAANAQTGFVTYALAQNASETYGNGGVGAYLTVTVPDTALTLNAGFQDTSDISGRTLSVRGYGKGQYASFANVLWSPTLPGLGIGCYNVVVYHQPSVPSQPGVSTGASIAVSQALGRTFGVFAQANYASGAVLPLDGSVAAGGIANDPFRRRSDDQLGLGVFVNHANHAAFTDAPPTSRRWEYGAEIYYAFTLAKGLQITPDAAVIVNPVLAPARGSAGIFTLRITSFL